MRSSLLFVLVLAGCVTDVGGSEPPRSGTLQIEIVPVDPAAVGASDKQPDEQTDEQPDEQTDEPDDVDLCALAAELAVDDVCSLICDPDAMAAQLALGGSEPGACYQLFCTLSEDVQVLVGVCLPP